MRFSSILFFLFIAIQLFSQNRIAIYDVQATRSSKTIVKDVSGYIVNYYASDDRFVVIDKANRQLIKEEQNRQKSEEFIDGYIVDQGKQEGYDYCYYPKYDEKEKMLSIRVYEIASGTVISSQQTKLKTSFLGSPKNMKAAINELIDKVNSDCFEIRYEIVRCTKEKKNEAKELLFAVGYNQRVEEGLAYKIYCMVEEKVGGKTLERKDFIGKGRIDSIEDGNFSMLKVKEGGKEILKKLNAGVPLYGSIDQ